MNTVASRVNDRWRYENSQILFLGEVGFAPEKSSEERNIAKNWHLVFVLGYVFRNQST